MVTKARVDCPTQKITVRDTISLYNYTLKHIVLEEHFLKMLLRPYLLTKLIFFYNMEDAIAAASATVEAAAASSS
ncbi:hypothetical protein YC2023_085244 [Brassica napus]